LSSCKSTCSRTFQCLSCIAINDQRFESHKYWRNGGADYRFYYTSKKWFAWKFLNAWYSSTSTKL